MAKAKQQELSIEKKLVQALLPVDEQPYEVLSNWFWTKLESIVTIKTGKKDANYGNENGEYLFFTCAAEPIRCDGYSFEGESLILAGNGANVGLVLYYNGHFEAYQRTYVLQSKSKLVLKYIYYHLNGFWTQYNADKQYGSATNYIKLGNFKEYPIPIPPLEEQQRIVDRIESLFEKLDNAKELAQNALDSFETRKAAILHKAFTGELTAQWREKTGLRMDSWERKRFVDCAEIKSNLVDPKDYLTYPHIAPDNIEKRSGLLLDYRTIEEDGVTSGKHRFYAGQILYSKIRPYLSKVVIVDFDGLCSADMYPIEAKGDTKYLWYYMLSDEFLEQASSAGSRSVLPKINQKELSGLTVKIPTLPEQNEVVRILDNLFEKEEKAKELCDVIDKIDLMKKAILARAFRGELGTNDPNEENALELLKECLK